MKIKTSGHVAAAAVGLALALSGAVWAHGDEKHDTAESKGAEKVTMTGEIVDMACFSAHDGKGAKHAVCAKECALGGAPVGLLTEDGTVYLLLENHSKPKLRKPYIEARGKVTETVTIMGDMYKRGGLNAIVVNMVMTGKAEK
ncbi:MAG: hypothetical protein M0D55_06825 [Elusimicrobiota bacterium]|nr:MAG: hypothetical protein M0D55_06825 [Elusimicrobiota bacterium]